MIPASLRRTIIVDGTEYEYCITGCVAVYIKNLKTKKEIKWFDDWKVKWKQSIKPRDIATIIKTGELCGKKCEGDI